MIEYSDQEFEKKLMILKDTQEAIQSLSTWCLKRHNNYKSIISIWLKTIRKVKIEKRLTLFYLANDVIQYSKKKNYKFVDGWATVIQKAIPFVRYEKIQSKILRIIKIWEERAVYDDSYLADLTGLLTTPIQKLKLNDPVQEFQIHALAVKIRTTVKLEQITDLKMKILKETKLPITNNEAIQNMLKDRTRSHEFLNELNDSKAKIESYIKCLKHESVERAQLIDALEVATSYYDEQIDEVKTVAQAYFNYTKRVKILKDKVDSMVSSMPNDSPMPSPDINAPSPSTSSVSVEDANVKNINFESVSNTGNFALSSSAEESCNNDVDVYVPTAIVNNTKSFITPESYNTVQELYDPASASFPVTENQDHQALNTQFPYDAPSPPPDETFTYSAFPSQTSVSYNNEMNKSSTYPTNSYETYVPAPMSSSQHYSNSEFLNIVPPSNSSIIVSESTAPVTLVQPTAWDGTINNNWSSNDTPASPPYHEKVSYQNAHIVNTSDGKPDLNHCILEPKALDRDERMTPQEIPAPDIDHRNLISLTHSPHMNSPIVSADVDYRAFPGIPMPPSPPAMLMEAVKPPKDNIESVDMDLSDDDEKPKSNQDHKHPILLPPPPPPPLPFDFDQPLVSDSLNQWEQPPQQWSNESSNFNENQWNVEQSEQWKQPNQWKPEQNNLNFVPNHPPSQSQWPQEKNKEDFRANWRPSDHALHFHPERGPRNFNRNPRPSGRWNQGSNFGPRNQFW